MKEIEVGFDSGLTGRVLRVSGQVQDPDPRPWTRHTFSGPSLNLRGSLRGPSLSLNLWGGSLGWCPSTNSYVKTSEDPRVQTRTQRVRVGSDPKPKNASGPGRIQPLSPCWSGALYRPYYEQV